MVFVTEAGVRGEKMVLQMISEAMKIIEDFGLNPATRGIQPAETCNGSVSQSNREKKHVVGTEEHKRVGFRFNSQELF